MGPYSFHPMTFLSDNDRQGAKEKFAHATNIFISQRIFIRGDAKEAYRPIVVQIYNMSARKCKRHLLVPRASVMVRIVKRTRCVLVVTFGLDHQRSSSTLVFMPFSRDLFVLFRLFFFEPLQPVMLTL